MNEIVCDTMVRELRPGDHVQAMWDERLLGTVISITPPMGEVVPLEEGATAEVPPIVIVQFGVGVVESTPQFLRVATWRWQCTDLKRI